MNKGHNYETVTQAIEDLKSRGYTHDFHYENSCLHCSKISEQYSAEDLKITEVYRFEGASDPDDNDVVYAVESNTGQKGILTDAYGAYADEHKAAFISNIKMEDNF